MAKQPAVRRKAMGIVAVVTGMALTSCAQGSTPATNSSTTSQTSASTSSSSSSSSSSAAGASSAAPGSSPGGTQTGPAILIGNQPFGDHGPMDDMAAGLDKCATDQGLTVKKIVALNASDYDSSIRGAVQQGYKLILTTFPQMSTATAAVAASSPDVKFAAVYQFINQSPAAPVANVWSTSFDVAAAAYVQGAMAGKLSKSGKLGFIVGDLDPTISAELNAFISGAKSTNSSAAVYWANANTFIDPAKGKDLAQAMISKGVDVLSTAAGQTQLGALDAAKAANILFFGDNGDNSATYPAGFISDLRSELGKNVVDACKDFAGGSFQGGKQTVYDLNNGGADVDTALITKWGKAANRDKDAADLVSLYTDLVGKINSGAVKVPNDTNTPKSAG